MCFCNWKHNNVRCTVSWYILLNDRIDVQWHSKCKITFLCEWNVLAHRNTTYPHFNPVRGQWTIRQTASTYAARVARVCTCKSQHACCHWVHTGEFKDPCWAVLCDTHKPSETFSLNVRYHSKSQASSTFLPTHGIGFRKYWYGM